jgi:hypothetical protein
MTEQQARYGWDSNLPTFSTTSAWVIRGRLEEFIRDAGERQARAWDESIPPLQREVKEVLSVNEGAADHSAMLECELPLESRSPGVVLLAKSARIIIELKGKHRRPRWTLTSLQPMLVTCAVIIANANAALWSPLSSLHEPGAALAVRRVLVSQDRMLSTV